MTTIAVTGAKGGCGASLVATNLALALTTDGESLLVDLHVGDAGDDLLLDLSPERSWADLLPVANELTERHVELAATRHASGLRLLAGPAHSPEAATAQALARLVDALAGLARWLVVDVSVRSEYSHVVFDQSERILITVTGDPPALRAAQRLIESLPLDRRERCGLVFNQITRAHPLHPATAAAAIGCRLLAALPSDPRGVGFQVNFGRPCVLDGGSRFGRGVSLLARGLSSRRRSEAAVA